MNLSLENIINQKIRQVFAALQLAPQMAAVKVSDRPDLSDFQCNGALALAKQERKNPREIAALIAEKLAEDKDFAKISVDGPGFLNMTLSDAFLAAVSPSIALISVGAGNDFGHPEEEVLNMLSRAGIPYYRTDENGTLHILLNGKKIQVETEK